MTGPSNPDPRRSRAVRITPTGASLVAGIVVAWVAGAALGYPALVVAAGGGAMAVLTAIVFVCWRPRVRVGREFSPSTVTAGETAAAVVEVTNLSRLRSPPVTVVDGVGNQDVELGVRALSADRSALVRYPLPTVRRGRVPLGPLRIVRSDPFGVLRRLQDHGGGDVLWVHAPRHRMAPLPSGVIMDLEGPVSDTLAEGSVSFSALREYVPGDDRRQIHWRSTARLGTLMVRQHIDTNEPRATVVLDARALLWPAESFEEGVSLAASVAHSVSDQGHRVTLRIVGEDLAASRALGAVTIDDRLAAAQTVQRSSFQSLFSVIEAAPAGGALILVTGRMEPVVEARLAAQGRRFSPVAVCSVVADRQASWRRRSGVRLICGPDAATTAGAWNTMVRS
ncbi:MAG: DUF58 domain-containing protein [Actinomycetota bacterium]|nr:DUF58 domain-containing protein [Actinomycetota bacterium]